MSPWADDVAAAAVLVAAFLFPIVLGLWFDFRLEGEMGRRPSMQSFHLWVWQQIRVFAEGGEDHGS